MTAAVASPDAEIPPARFKVRGRFQPRTITGGSLLATSGLTALFGIVFWSVAARNTTPTELGVNTTLVSAAMGVASIGQLSLSGTLPTLLPAAGSGSRRLVGRSVAAASAASALLGIGFVVVAPQLSGSLDALRNPWLALGFVLAVVVLALFALEDIVLASIGRALWIPVENLAYSIAKLGMVAALAAGVAGFGIFVSWTLPAVLAALPILVVIFRSLLPRGEASPHLVVGHSNRSVARFAAYEVVGMVFFQVSTTLLPVLVTTQLGAADSGRFFIPWTIAQSLDLVAINLAMAVTVHSATERHTARSVSVRVLLRVEVFLVAVAAVGALGAPRLLQLFSDYATAAAPALRVLLLAAIVRAVVTFAVYAARTELDVKRLVGYQVAVAVLVIGLTIALSGSFGLVGPALAWLIANAVPAVVAIPWLLRHRSRAPRQAIVPTLSRTVQGPVDPAPRAWEEWRGTIQLASVAGFASLLVLSALGGPTVLKALAALVVLGTMPGVGLMDRNGPAEVASRLALVIATSLAVWIGATCASLWLHLWHPAILVMAIGGATVVHLAVTRLAASHRASSRHRDGHDDGAAEIIAVVTALRGCDAGTAQRLVHEALAAGHVTDASADDLEVALRQAQDAGEAGSA